MFSTQAAAAGPIRRATSLEAGRGLGGSSLILKGKSVSEAVKARFCCG